MNSNQFLAYESEINEKTWLEEVLADNAIPYTIEIIPYWTGIKVARYHEKRCIYVDLIYKERVADFITEYENPENAVYQDEEFPAYNSDGIPQILCPSCGKKIDFDYPKCPIASIPCWTNSAFSV